jgi:hypothetical protein
MFLDKSRNAGVGDYFELASALVAVPFSMFAMIRTNDWRVGETADFMFFFSVGNSAATNSVSCNTEAPGGFQRMVAAGLGGGPELNFVQADLGLWDAEAISAPDGTHQSLAGVFSSRGGGGDWWEDSTIVAAFGAGWNRTRIGRIADAQASQSAVHGEVLCVAAWNVALTLSELKMLALGQHPLSVRPASLVAYWPLLGMNLVSWIAGPAALAVTGEPRVGTLPGNRSLDSSWHRKEARPVMATVMRARRMTAR